MTQCAQQHMQCVNLHGQPNDVLCELQGVWCRGNNVADNAVKGTASFTPFGGECSHRAMLPVAGQCTTLRRLQ